jgi:hypothetical protein
MRTDTYLSLWRRIAIDQHSLHIRCVRSSALNIPHLFQPGGVIRADQINENFQFLNDRLRELERKYAQHRSDRYFLSRDLRTKCLKDGCSATVRK